MSREEIIFTVQESPEGGFEARALGAAIFTEGDTMEELRAMVREAVDCHFDEEDRPGFTRFAAISAGTRAPG